ncbi:hypothetical protein [Paenibacillus sp. UASWS1643]|uniref:hypothetical protein n=1 Tax=Paenibacillus sp. UASWS1643 TaxID=2580422 RepID=UPI00123939A1|nr:hypothetical protein [Paenibacillus sp. UASWS1643]KAA8750155.1 hypothetical protein FE296_16305 [Paenibacillus sp. UASWS1643]
MAADDPASLTGVSGRRCHAGDCEGARRESEFSERLNADNALSRRISVACAGASVAYVGFVVAAGSVASFAAYVGYFRRLFRIDSVRATMDITNPTTPMIVITVVISITSHICLTCAVHCGILE